MGRIIAVANQKGGVGKTTTALSLGAALAELGQRVLLVDLDPQASLTLSLGVTPDSLDATVHTLLQAFVDENEQAPHPPIRTTSEGMDLLPANMKLSQAEAELTNDALGLYALSDALRPLVGDYDYTFIDCPPSLGVLTVNALTAADSVLIPLQADFLALKGVDLLLGTIAKIRRLSNSDLSIAGILITMADLRTLHAKEIIAAARDTLGRQLPVFETIVRSSVRLKEAPVQGSSILTYDPRSRGAQAYRDLAKELRRG